MRGNYVAGVLAGLFVLSSCGGGGSSGADPVSVPSPTPSPSPSASPTPTPTYSTYVSLTGDQQFDLACATVNSNGSSIVLGQPIAFDADPGLTLTYTAADDSYAVNGSGVSEIFTPADIDNSFPNSEAAYSKADSVGSRLIIGAPAPGGMTAQYTRGLYVLVQNTITSNVDEYVCAFGVPTLISDPPAETNVTFTGFSGNGVLRQYQSDGTVGVYSLTTSSESASVNTTTGQIDFAFSVSGTLIATYGPGTAAATVDLGSFTGQTTMDGIAQNFGGILSHQDNTIQSQYQGWFFGPQGKELNLGAAILQDSGGGNRVVGTLGFTANR